MNREKTTMNQFDAGFSNVGHQFEKHAPVKAAAGKADYGDFFSLDNDTAYSGALMDLNM